MTWKTMETPPTDWGSYLVWHEKYGMETLFWQHADGWLNERKAGNWYSEDDNADDYPQNYRVTHWMPLPEPPTKG